MQPEKMEALIDLAERSEQTANRAQRLLKVIKESGDGEGMKTVRDITWLLLRQAFFLWWGTRIRR